MPPNATASLATRQQLQGHQGAALSRNVTVLSNEAEIVGAQDGSTLAACADVAGSVWSGRTEIIQEAAEMRMRASEYEHPFRSSHETVSGGCSVLDDEINLAHQRESGHE